ncbi:MAG: hypothetical protein KDD78_20420, partial [Caldilineaceae bacterium]|nr:hypothetical protein [Caldilineaceae bacterium]
MSVPKRFSILRFFGSLLKVLAWIVLVLSIVGAVIAAIFGSSLSTMLSGQSVVDPTLLSTGGGFVAGIITLILG